MSATPLRENNIYQPLVLTAAILGIFQGIAWTGLSIAAIIVYYSDDPPSVWSFAIYIYESYIYKDADSEDYLTGSEFIYIYFVYLVISVTWLVVSLCLLWATRRKKFGKIYYKSILAWIVVASLTVLLDLIVVCIVGYNYATVYNKYWDQVSGIDGSTTSPTTTTAGPDESDDDSNTYLKIIATAVAAGSNNSVSRTHLVAQGIVMTIAARGFVLWIVNVIFIIVLFKHALQLQKKQAYAKNSIGRDDYSSSRVPWRNTMSAYDNPSLTPDTQPSVFKFPPLNRSEREHNPRRYPSSNVLYNENSRPQSKQYMDLQSPSRTPTYVDLDRTAKIGRPTGQRNTSLAVHSPQIPDPDYSPPGSVNVRSALRPKTNYAMY
ncbi:hypothetical protein ABEB36_001331 [Hypothenemus hampei]|uniref:Uncharacterized protein n=1 Tax=Hypothenemus hampei TaxID=57062 RepID=A0ABD1FE82_HYPHA